MSRRKKPMTIALRDLKAPGKDLLEALRDVDYRYCLPADKKFISEEFAQKTIEDFPLTVHGKKNEVISNIRVFQIMVAVFGDQPHKKIVVKKFVNSKVPRAELKEIACQDLIHPISLFSARDPEPTIYAFNRVFRESGLKKIDFFRSHSIRNMAKMFEVSTHTVQKIFKGSKKNGKP